MEILVITKDRICKADLPRNYKNDLDNYHCLCTDYWQYVFCVINSRNATVLSETRSSQSKIDESTQIGPRITPWGTPQVRGRVENPKVRTEKERDDKWVLNHAREISVIPNKTERRWRRIERFIFMASKASNRSRRLRQETFQRTYSCNEVAL